MQARRLRYWWPAGLDGKSSPRDITAAFVAAPERFGILWDQQGDRPLSRLLQKYVHWYLGISPGWLGLVVCPLGSSGKAFHDTQVPLRAVTERLQRSLIARAVVRSDGFLHAVELNYHYTLHETRLVRFRRFPAHQKSRAGGLHCRCGELAVCLDFFRIADGVKKVDPISFGHD